MLRDPEAEPGELAIVVPHAVVGGAWRPWFLLGLAGAAPGLGLGRVGAAAGGGVAGPGWGWWW
ncbi:MAG TPA: hypothetical protein VG276_18165, partial [Actinomycetes bacterium]|nr:hypothetical protein [Actinomycetes bacterium]